MSFVGIGLFLAASVLAALCISVIKAPEGDGGHGHGHHGGHGHH
ncbi:MAG: hypothetical protein ACOVN0_20085 [Niveispirillum sp.]